MIGNFCSSECLCLLHHIQHDILVSRRVVYSYRPFSCLVRPRVIFCPIGKIDSSLWRRDIVSDRWYPSFLQSKWMLCPYSPMGQGSNLVMGRRRNSGHMYLRLSKGMWVNVAQIYMVKEAQWRGTSDRQDENWERMIVRRVMMSGQWCFGAGYWPRMRISDPLLGWWFLLYHVLEDACKQRFDAIADISSPPLQRCLQFCTAVDAANQKVVSLLAIRDRFRSWIDSSVDIGWHSNRGLHCRSTFSYVTVLILETFIPKDTLISATWMIGWLVCKVIRVPDLIFYQPLGPGVPSLDKW